MSQLYALLYKNFKVMSKQTSSTLMILIVPILCLVMALALQLLAKDLSDKHHLVPPFDVPFGAAFPINVPLDIPIIKEMGARSCLRMHKYGFTPYADIFTERFVKNNLNFDSYSGIRNFICKQGPDHGIISPHFNRTSISSVEEMNKDILDEMDELYDTDLNSIQRKYTPTDGYYLFDEASSSYIAGVIQSNNMINFLYHHRNLQTSLFVDQSIPVP